MIAALTTFTVGLAQNTNEKEVKTTKKTIVTDTDGVDVKTKTVETKSRTNLALGNKTSSQNFNTIMKPTTIMTDVDYSYGGVNYRFMPEKDGYYIVNTNNKNAKVARLYPSTQKGYYIYSQEGNNSFGYFNADGDLVIESYDPDNDGVMNYIYKVKNDKKMKKNKMKMKKDKMK